MLGEGFIEVTNVSSHGFWLLWNGQEHFLSFADFPWFRDASFAAISHVEQQGKGHLYWPELDVDLSLNIIDQPDKYPLASKN